MTESADEPRILLAHGGGGELARELITRQFLPAFNDRELSRLADAAVVSMNGDRLAFTTDSFVVKPLFFRGGDIGRLAVSGTVNDLAAVGARPLYLSLSFIIEEGLPLRVLSQVVSSVKTTAEEARVRVVCGDTKVVERRAADQLFVTTSGIGRVEKSVHVGAERIVPGDALILSGTLGDHAIAVMSAREALDFQTVVESDVAPLGDLVASALGAGDVHAMRDPTRGGLAAVLNELAAQARVGVELVEQDIPVAPAVRAACDMLGLDVLQAANEGKMVFFVQAGDAAAVLEALRAHPLGRRAAMVGRVMGDHPGTVWVRTEAAGKRVVDCPVGELLPRIC